MPSFKESLIYSITLYVQHISVSIIFVSSCFSSWNPWEYLFVQPHCRSLLCTTPLPLHDLWRRQQPLLFFPAPSHCCLVLTPIFHIKPLERRLKESPVFYIRPLERGSKSTCPCMTSFEIGCHIQTVTTLPPQSRQPLEISSGSLSESYLQCTMHPWSYSLSHIRPVSSGCHS